MATQRRKPKRHLLPVIVVGVGVIGLGAGAYAVVTNILNSGPTQPKKVVQEIKVIRPPPPPPDLPPPPPPPPEEKVSVNEPEPQPDPTPSNDPPPGEQLGLDADGSGAGDAFGLVGRKGGRDLLASGGSAFAWYAGLLKNEIVDQLQAETRVRGAQYTVIVRVWVRDDGTVERVRIAQSSGDHERDKAIEDALARITRISQAPPADMPQPISLRIVSRA
jgi:periplasmic protein TonB